MPNRDPQLVHRKVAVLGFRAVGKTSLTTSFVSGTFDETYDPTIENTHHKTIRFRKVHFATDIIDTAGMDEYSRLSRNASVGVDGYVLVYSITSRNSFDRINQINESLLSALGDAIDIPRVLVGSMLDLSDQERQVSTREAQAMADSWGVPYLECSSKTGENVNDVFHSLLREVSKDDDLLNEKEENRCNIL
jgi:Ras family protein